MKKLEIILIFVFMLDNLCAQIGKTKSYTKHEIGFSVGAFPLIGLEGYGAGFIFYPHIFKHTYHIEDINGYEKAYHLGSYTLKYSYHFKPKHSFGGSVSWVGRHVDKYRIYTNAIVDGSGWIHYFTVQGNYRYTYYQNNKISLFCEIYSGLTLYITDDVFLPKSKYEILPALHLNIFGMDLGGKYKFLLELGIGTQGLFTTGFSYKFSLLTD